MRESEPPDETGTDYAGADLHPDDDRETIWGINRKDRRLFQALTLTGGKAGSIAVTVLQLKYRSPDDTPDMIALNIILGIGASFVASGFISWDLVQIKEVSMAVADWIREHNVRKQARNRERWREEGRAEGRVEGYYIGYTDGKEGNPQRPPSGNAEKLS